MRASLLREVACHEHVMRRLHVARKRCMSRGGAAYCIKGCMSLSGTRRGLSCLTKNVYVLQSEHERKGLHVLRFLRQGVSVPRWARQGGTCVSQSKLAGLMYGACRKMLPCHNMPSQVKGEEGQKKWRGPVASACAMHGPAFSCPLVHKPLISPVHYAPLTPSMLQSNNFYLTNNFATTKRLLVVILRTPC